MGIIDFKPIKINCGITTHSSREMHREQALIALERAKELEKKKRLKPIRVDSKTVKYVKK